MSNRKWRIRKHSKGNWSVTYPNGEAFGFVDFSDACCWATHMYMTVYMKEEMNNAV